MVTQAIDMIAAHKPFDIVRKKFEEAWDGFSSAKGSNRPLLNQCQTQLKAMQMKQELLAFTKSNFLVKGRYNLDDRFAEILDFVQMLGDFFSKYAGDSFLEVEVNEVKSLVEEICLLALPMKGVLEMFSKVRSTYISKMDYITNALRNGRHTKEPKLYYLTHNSK